MNTVGEKLHELRKLRKLSLRELGEKLEVDFTHLSKIEKGSTKPSLDLLEKMATFFDVKISYLFGEEKEVPEILKEKGVEWIAFGEEMENKDLTPERIKEILEFVEKLKNMS